MQKKRKKAELVLKLIIGFVAAAAMIILLAGIFDVAKESTADGLKQLDTSVRRSVMACYATEGVYPPDIEYLEEHYGLQIDRERYEVKYSVFAENLMPDITVMEKAG